MRILINNTVKTDTSDYTFNTREEAEAFYMTLRVERGEERSAPAQHREEPAPAGGGRPRSASRQG